MVAREHVLSPFGKDVFRSIHGGVEFLLSRQLPDGSWADVEQDAKTGMTSLVVLALFAAGERVGSPAIDNALEFLRRFGPGDLHSTYAISLQTMALAAAGDERDGFRIAESVRWLERAQIKVGDPQPWAGSWSYSISSIRRPGDNSNSQYALLGLAAAGEASVQVDPSVWLLARAYWERCQQRDGSWTYTPEARASTASMTCAGISSLAASRPRSGSWEGQEVLKDDAIHNCGSGQADSQLQRGIDWLGTHFRVDENSGSGKQWRFYYLYGLERAGA